MYDTPDRRPRDPDEVYGWSRSHGGEIVAADEWDGPCIRCSQCGRVDHADGLHEWDRATNYDSLVPVCTVCECPASDRDVVKGGPCQRCFREVAQDGADYCLPCEAVIEAEYASRTAIGDEVVALIREITLAQTVRP